MTTTQTQNRLTADRWVELLSEEHPRAREEVILVCKLRKPYVLRVSKTALREAFGKIEGIQLMPRRSGIFVSPVSVGERSFELPQRMAQQLKLTPGCHVCITRRRETGKCALKRLDLQSGETDVPGSVVIDSFSQWAVTRTHYARTDLSSVDIAVLKDLVARMGPFRYGPLTALRRSQGRLGFLVRDMLGRKTTAGDREFIKQSCAAILNDQDEGGSWGDNLVTTASNVIRLSEMGRTIAEPPIAKAADWLLSSPETIGLPGLFAATLTVAEDFNRLKPNGEARRMIYDKTRRGSKFQLVRDAFHSNSDVLPGVCELAVTSASAVVLEALLMLGLSDHPRVKKAINTFLLLWHGRWCGCGYFGPDRVVGASVKRPDFESRFALDDWQSWLRDSAAAWFGETKRSQMTAPRSPSWQVGEHEVLIEHQVNCGDYCTFGVHQALSWHPGYGRSNLETVAALEYSRRQTSLGRWGPSRSIVLENLARLSHPLAAFLVARTVPQLIRDQETSGLWPEGDAESLRILKALDHFGFLASLIPSRSPVAEHQGETSVGPSSPTDADKTRR